MKAYRSFLLLAVLIISGCTPAVVQQPTSEPTLVQQPTQTLPATATVLPSATPTLMPSNTPEPTSTPVPPTATQVPPLAVVEDGFDAWCAPLDYAGTKPAGFEAPEYARKMTYAADQPVVSIPAVYCAIVYRFNQAIPADLELRIFEGSSMFVKLPLMAADGHPDVGWSVVEHSYVVNPPLWEVTYRLAVVGPGEEELWSSPVKFAKPLPETCLFGGLPDPVTLYCAVTDPWEIEPHPGVEYPYDRSRLTPDP